MLCASSNSTRTSFRSVTCLVVSNMLVVSYPYRNGTEDDPGCGTVQEDQVTLVLPGTCSYLFWQLGI